MKITNSKEQHLMKRKEVEGYIDHKGSKTPTRTELKELISKELKTPIEFISIIKATTEFGSHKTSFKAHIYQDVKQLKNFEKKKKKEQPKEEKK